MTDVLIRQVPETVVASIDQAARALGLSRNEYLRRQIVARHSTDARAVTLADLQRACAAANDLEDDDVMAAAWR